MLGDELRYERLVDGRRTAADAVNPRRRSPTRRPLAATVAGALVVLLALTGCAASTDRRLAEGYLPAPAGGRTVVGWGHPTTGAAQKCAPSNGIDPFDLIEGMSNLLNAGYVVAAADYPGLGVAGPNSYLIGTSEGNSVLDAVRAAQSLPEAGVGSNKNVLLWGHSQGGQAVLFAGHDAKTYAPELQVRGVAAAAPAADLGPLLDDDIADASGVTIGSYAFAAYQSVYSATVPGLSLDQVLTPAGAAATPGIAELCLLGQHDELHAQALALVGRYLSHDPATTKPWSTLLAQNTPVAPIGVPLYVAQASMTPWCCRAQRRPSSPRNARRVRT